KFKSGFASTKSQSGNRSSINKTSSVKNNLFYFFGFSHFCNSSSSRLGFITHVFTFHIFTSNCRQSHSFHIVYKLCAYILVISNNRKSRFFASTKNLSSDSLFSSISFFCFRF